jgi:hypothetical protein
LLQKHGVVAGSVVLLHHVIERIAGAVGGQYRQGEPVAVVPIAQALAVGVADELQGAGAHVGQKAGKGVRGAVQHPETARPGQAQALHVEVQVGDELLLELLVPVEPGAGARDLRHPQEADGAPRLGQLALLHQAEIGAAHLEGRSAAGGIVVSALLEVPFVEVRGDRDLLVARAVAGNGGMHHFRLGREDFRLDDRAQGDLLALGQPRREATLT